MACLPETIFSGIHSFTGNQPYSTFSCAFAANRIGSSDRSHTLYQSSSHAFESKISRVSVPQILGPPIEYRHSPNDDCKSRIALEPNSCLIDSTEIWGHVRTNAAQRPTALPLYSKHAVRITSVTSNPESISSKSGTPSPCHPDSSSSDSGTPFTAYPESLPSESSKSGSPEILSYSRRGQGPPLHAHHIPKRRQRTFLLGEEAGWSCGKNGRGTKADSKHVSELPAFGGDGWWPEMQFDALELGVEVRTLTELDSLMSVDGDAGFAQRGGDWSV